MGAVEESFDSGKRRDEHGTYCVSSPLSFSSPYSSCQHPQTNETLTIITNDAIIGVNQDPGGSAASRIWKRTANGGGDLSLWSGSMQNLSVVPTHVARAKLTLGRASVFVFALMNASPEMQTVDVLMSDVFLDQVGLFANDAPLRSRFVPSSRIRLLQGPIAQAEAWLLWDLWAKDDSGKWGKPLGTIEGKIPAVQIRPHQTKVWRAIPANLGSTAKIKRAEL